MGLGRALGAVGALQDVVHGLGDVGGLQEVRALLDELGRRPGAGGRRGGRGEGRRPASWPHPGPLHCPELPLFNTIHFFQKQNKNKLSKQAGLSQEKTKRIDLPFFGILLKMTTLEKAEASRVILFKPRLEQLRVD